MKYKVKAKVKGERTARLVYSGNSLTVMLATANRMCASEDVTTCEVTVIDSFGKEEVALCK